MTAAPDATTTTTTSIEPPTPPAKAKPAHEGGYRDTVESILIAFILAFVFRAFVVEAFVIPTGSMAPTLLGAHARFTCERCGYQFECNFPQTAGSEDSAIPAEVKHDSFPTSDCPNCSYTVHENNDVKNREPVPIHYGDRILVLKYAYLGREPQRWDVVVFKSPDDPAPGSGWYVTNFIKRLVGNPGETLMVLDGDVYVSTDPAAGPDNWAAFKVQTKPRHVQDALWRLVYDNDFLAIGKPRDDATPWRQPWTVQRGAGWDLGTAEQPRRVFTFDAASGTGAIRFDNNANEGRAFTDWLAYAQHESGRNPVSDVKLSFHYQRTAGDGRLLVQLTKLGETFTAELTRGRARIFRASRNTSRGGTDDLGTEIASATVPDLAGGGDPVAVDFMNVDYNVTLRVGGKDVLTAAYDPDIAALKSVYDRSRSLPKPDVRVIGENQTCALSHISLWRDVYYTNGGQGGITRGTPSAPVTLGPDEYFVLGDNTVISKDARYWDKPIDLPAEELSVAAGRVPKRFLLGKAFFVYWPAGFRPFGISNSPGFIPNFGDMRSIH
jgi:signal peptidase I